jgi:MerR family redox-sensitive transcriptional activator SoxR
MPERADMLTIGQVAQRSGVAPSALRFYEAEGLISSQRSDGNQRRFARAVLRRVAVIQGARRPRLVHRLRLPLAALVPALQSRRPRRGGRPGRALSARRSARARHTRPMKPERMNAFSDGVIAILITILVLELRPPEGHHLSDVLD